MSEYRIRVATPADAGIIARHRVGMFADMGELLPDAAPIVEAESRARLARELASGEYVGWLVESSDGQVVAGAGVVMHAYYPSAVNPRGRPTAYILNVFTEPSHRRRGLAGRLVSEILAWCRTRDLPRVTLHASISGRAVYERLGFRTTNEMRVDLSDEKRKEP